MKTVQSDGIDFLGIGVQKSASSWLHSVLATHADVWMPPRKELHYFDRSTDYPSPSFLATDTLHERLNSNEEHNQLFKNKIENELKSKINNENIRWYLQYFLGTYNDEWYKSLFADGKGKLRGEITPAYSILNTADIAKIKALFPALKVILILRNPIERAWSQARFYMTRNHLDLENDIQKMKTFIDSDLQTTRGDYKSILKNWSSVFPKEQLFIGFYDEIGDDLNSFISKISTFLDIDEKELLKNEEINEKKNVSVDIEIPQEIREYLTKKYYNDIVELSTMFGGYPKKWLKEL